jgi:hypothetical protein
MVVMPIDAFQATGIRILDGQGIVQIDEQSAALAFSKPQPTTASGVEVMTRFISA